MFACLTFRKRQPIEPIINNPVTNRALAKIAANLFRLYGHYYILMINYYSKFIIIETLEIYNFQLL